MGEGKGVRRSSQVGGSDEMQARSSRCHNGDGENRSAASRRESCNVAGSDTMALLAMAALVIHPLMVALVAGHRGRSGPGGGFGGRAGVRQVEPRAYYPGTQQNGKRCQEGPKTGLRLHEGGSLDFGRRAGKTEASEWGIRVLVAFPPCGGGGLDAID